MTALGTLVLAWGLVAVLMVAGWHWQRRHRNAGIVDVLWAVGMGLAAVVVAAGAHGAALPRVLVAVLAVAWSTRLAVHLWRRVRAEPEDGRYAHLRRHWRDDQGRFLLFFQAQALLVGLFALPFVAVAANPVTTMTHWTWLGLALWLLSVAGEAVADAQLARYRQRPGSAGRTCREGLWRYSRHPNYFFEWLHWFAYVALAVGSPLAWLAWAGPLLMYVFLRWISGIPYTEAQALRTRGDDYRDYQQRTPMLFPWFPRAPGAGHRTP